MFSKPTLLQALRWSLTLSTVCLLNSAFSATVVVKSDFEDGFGPWKALSEGRWELQQNSGSTVAALVEEGRDRPPVRRPRAYLLLEGYAFSDFVFTARVQSLEPSSVRGRDVVIIFGYIDDTHYYYAHLSNDSNGTVHNVIMKVMGDTRVRINNEPRPEPRLDDGWQEVKITRDKEGNIAVYMQDLETPLMTAQDTEYPLGTLGVGAFDDRALFDDIRIEGSPPEPLSIEWPAPDSGPTLFYTAYEGIPYTLKTSNHLLAWTPVRTSPNPLFTSRTSLALPSPRDLPRYYRIDYTLPALPTQ